jgi:hypothetical protein
MRLQGSSHSACFQPVLTLEGERSTTGSVSLLWQQVVVYAVRSSSVVSGLAESQIAVSLIIVVVFITFLLSSWNSPPALREVRPHNVVYCIHLVSYCKQRWFIVFSKYLF